MLNNYYEDIVILNPTRQPDGMGGFVASYAEGKVLKGAIVTRNNIERLVAEKHGVDAIYKLYTSREDAPKHDAIIKRISDGATFRIASRAEDIQSPQRSGLNIAITNARRFVIK